MAYRLPPVPLSLQIVEDLSDALALCSSFVEATVDKFSDTFVMVYLQLRP
jgi:hypothetical protein